MVERAKEELLRLTPLGSRVLRATARAAAVVLALAVFAGLVRVLPWLLAPDVPLRVAGPFARGLLAVGLETTLLVAPPIGWALGAAALVEHGEARAFFAIGVAPARLLRGTLLPLSLVGALGAVCALTWGRDAVAPGRLARALVEESRASCAGASAPHAVHIPLIDASWLCFPGEAPRIAGQLPGTQGATFTASRLSLSDDLRAVDLDDLRILFANALRLHVGGASIRGLVPWARASNLGPALRALIFAVTAVGAALLSGYFVLAKSHGGRLLPLLIGASGPIASLWLLSVWERGDATSWVYLTVPLSGWVAPLVAGAMIGRLRGERWQNRSLRAR